MLFPWEQRRCRNLRMWSDESRRKWHPRHCSTGFSGWNLGPPQDLLKQTLLVALVCHPWEFPKESGQRLECCRHSGQRGCHHPRYQPRFPTCLASVPLPLPLHLGDFPMFDQWCSGTPSGSRCLLSRHLPERQSDRRIPEGASGNPVPIRSPHTGTLYRGGHRCRRSVPRR